MLDYAYGYYDDEIFSDVVVSHAGVDHEHARPGHPGSGRYPWGSGMNPYQHEDGTGLYADKLLSRIQTLKKQGLSEKEIWDELGMGGLGAGRTRAIIAVANDEVRRQQVLKAKDLFYNDPDCKGNYSAVARKMGLLTASGKPQDTSVRKLLDSELEYRMMLTRNAADLIESEIDKKGVLDIGAEVEKAEKFGQSGIYGMTTTMMDQVKERLKLDGYDVFSDIKVPQVTNPGNNTTFVLATKHIDGYTDTDMKREVIWPAVKGGTVESLDEYATSDGGETFQKWTFPPSLDPSRLSVVYAEQGGTDRDGLVLIKPGVEDLSLGDATYSQVRIRVGDDLYIKGMAAYGNIEDFPPGVDAIFNTNKHEGTPLEDTLKHLKGVNGEAVSEDNPVDKENPFGSAIKEGPDGQRWYDGPNGEKLQSLINKRADEGDWSEWKDKLPSQFLSKQSEALIAKQLNETIAKKQAEFDEIDSLTNPTIKNYYMEKFAESCDTAASDLSACSLPGQKYQVLMPSPSLGKNECYDPNYPDGAKLALVRYPHGGTFEIPIVTNNLKNKESQDLIGLNSQDAICIPPSVAGRLSGADFDGDTAAVIPLTSANITSTDLPAALKNYEPKVEYGSHKGDVVKVKKVDPKTGEVSYVDEQQWISNVTGKPFKPMSHKNMQTEMGKITNLIMDMTLNGAPVESPDGVDIAHAVRHSMTIIDSEKHHLDYLSSKKDNNIDAMMNKWQQHTSIEGVEKTQGAATLITRAGSEYTVAERRGEGKVNLKGKSYYNPDVPEGELMYETTGRSYTKVTYNAKGEAKESTVTNTTKITQMDAVYDARDLLSKNPNKKEIMYADFANEMKSLARKARISYSTTSEKTFSKSAERAYATEVASLNAKLNEALKNRPRERRAQIIATSRANAMIQAASHTLSKEEQKKIKQKAITSARNEVGSISRKNRSIEITDSEWNAIQAHAIGSTKLRDILNNTNPDDLRKRAMPKTSTELSASKIASIKAYKNSKLSNAEIAAKFGVSVSTVSKYLNS